MVNVLNCDLKVGELKFQLSYCIHFWTNTLGKDINLFIFQAMGLIVPLLFFYKDNFGIK